jgi:hypothetical protein
LPWRNRDEMHKALRGRDPESTLSLLFSYLSVK